MTAEELCQLPEIERLDRRLIRGRLVERSHPYRSPAHASALANICAILHEWRKPEWGVYGYGCPYRVTRDPDTLLCYDASVVPGWVLDISPENPVFLDGRPDLVVEVLDRSDTPESVSELIDWSLFGGVGAVWQVDPFEQTVTVHRAGRPAITHDTKETIDMTDVLPGFICQVASLFES